MFCSVKKDKKNNNYRVYICDRYRDKKTGKVKSSDKYIMTLPKENILSLTSDEIRREVEDKFINKGVNLDNVDLVLNKLIEFKGIVTKEYNTTDKEDVVLKGKDTTNKNVEIVQGERVESVAPTYDTTIMFDVQRMYRENVKTSMKFELMSKAFGIKEKDRFEIEEEEFKKIQDHGERIRKQIDEIYEEYLRINEQNEELKALRSDIELVQDIYIDCYDKFPKSEVWLIGAGYIRRIYGKLDFVLPRWGEKIFEGWEAIKEEDKLDDNKAYFNHEEYFEEIDLYRENNLDIDKSDITGSLLRMILSGNYEIDMSFSDWIDIKVEGDTISLSIEHLIDWVNNKPTRDYKVNIDNLKEYKKQLYKFKKIY